MDNPRVVTPQEWLAARKDLLAREKEATRAKDAVDAARRALPMTEVILGVRARRGSTARHLPVA